MKFCIPENVVLDSDIALTLDVSTRSKSMSSCSDFEYWFVCTVLANLVRALLILGKQIVNHHLAVEQVTNILKVKQLSERITRRILDIGLRYTLA